VIWLAGLIAAITTGFAIKVRLNTIEASQLQQSVEAEFLADGMARYVAWRIAAQDELPSNGKPQSCAWEKSAIVSYRVQDQSGLADLNSLPGEVYHDIFVGLGASAELSKKLTQELLDYRDADSQSGDIGFEPERYAGRAFGPKNSPFQTVEELDQLPSMTDAIYRPMKSLVTVYSLQPGIDPATAPAGLRKVLNQPAEGGFTGAMAGFAGATEGKTFGIDVSVSTKSGGRFRRKMIVVVLRQPDRPYAVMTWQQGDEWVRGDAVAGSLPACFPVAG
jgi:general secretion pathway protein K